MSLPGNPAALRDRADAYVNAARLIDQAADDLRRLAFSSESDAIDALQTKSIEVANDLDAAHGRYNGTAYALQEYAVTLQELHARADAAEESLAQANYRQRGVASNATVTEARLEKALEDPATPTATIQQLEANLRQLDAQASAVAGTIDAAQGQINQAHADLEDAAQKAIDAINSAIKNTNENWLDQMKKFVEDVGDFFDMVGQWIAKVFDDAYHEFMRLVSSLRAIIVAALIILLAVAVIALVVGLAVLTGGGSVALAVLIASTFAKAALILVAGMIVWRIASDVLAPDPEVTDKQVDLQKRTAPRGPADALLETGEVDNAAASETADKDLDGQADAESVVKVTKVVDADGTVRWRVALPSTQEWLSMIGKDGGATNDIDSNIALMLTPSLRTQYERAVLEAMRQAGVGEDDPVMLIGFSQGGIMAGHLAAYNNDYNWSAVIASGAPIDNMPIPENVTVVSVQHNGDPVPQLDTWTQGGGGPREDSHWHTIVADAPENAAALEDIHNADNYALTLRNHADELASLPGELDEYFVDSGDAYGSKTTYYRWNE